MGLEDAMERGIRKCLTFVIRQIAEISEIRNFCLWNPQSWALQSGMQLKESGIPLTTRNPNASSNTEILGAERIQLLSQIHQLYEAILCCLDQSVYQHNRQSSTEEEMTSFIDSIPIIFCSVLVQLYNYSLIQLIQDNQDKDKTFTRNGISRD